MAGSNTRKKRSKSSSAKPQEEHETDTETETELDETSLQTLLDKQTETISQRILADIESKIQKAINDATADLGKELTEQREYNRGLKDAVTSLTNKLKSQEERIVSLEANAKGADESGRALRKLVNELVDKNEQYSRRDSIRVNGIEYKENESDFQFKTRIIETLNEEITDTNASDIKWSDIHRLHYNSKKYPMNKHKSYINNRLDEEQQIEIDDTDTTQTAEVIIKFTNWDARTTA